MLTFSPYPSFTLQPFNNKLVVDAVVRVFTVLVVGDSKEEGG